MRRLALPLSLTMLALWPSAGIAADYACWQLQPKPGGADGWIAWTTPDGDSYGIPEAWDVERAYEELKAAGLCVDELPHVEEPNQDEPETVESITDEPPQSLLEQRAAEARAKYGPDSGEGPSSDQPGDNGDGVAIIAGFGALIWAIFGSAKEDSMADMPYSMRQKTVAPPPANGAHQEIIAIDHNAISSGVTTPSPWLNDQIPPSPYYSQQVWPQTQVTGHDVSPAPVRPDELNLDAPVVRGGSDEVVRTGGAGQLDKEMFLRDAPYDMGNDDSFLRSVLRAAINGGLSKNETMKQFFYLKDGDSEYKKVFLSKGNGKDYTRFSELYDDVKWSIDNNG